MPLTKEEILRKATAQTKVIHVDSLDDDIYLKQLPASDVLELVNKFQAKELSEEDYTYEMVALSVIDASGEKVFTSETVRQITVGVMTELAELVADFNNIQVKKVQAAENLKKVRQKHS